jgi:hypothetical protein
MRCRRLRTLTPVVTVAGLSLLAAGCGGAGSPRAGVANVGATTTAAAATGGSLAEYARCMRSHGVSSFPDPASLVSSRAIKEAKRQMARIAAGKTSSATVQAAQRVCVRYAPPEISPPPVSPQAMQKLLAVSRCMRAHGIQSFPDPNPSTGELTAPAGISKSSPHVLAALRACGSLAQAAGLGPPSTGP